MNTPVSVLDAAAYILNKQGEMSTWKLQKLCYYSQAWSLVWDEEPLFKEEIEAWAHGPVVKCLYKHHKGQFAIASLRKGHPETLDADQAETIDVVLEMYGDKPGATLRRLTHAEPPWREARQRGRLALGERGNEKIDLDRMAEYYSSLYDEEEEE